MKPWSQTRLKSFNHQNCCKKNRIQKSIGRTEWICWVSSLAVAAKAVWVSESVPPATTPALCAAAHLAQYCALARSATAAAIDDVTVVSSCSSPSPASTSLSAKAAQTASIATSSLNMYSGAPMPSEVSWTVEAAEASKANARESRD